MAPIAASAQLEVRPAATPTTATALTPLAKAPLDQLRNDLRSTLAGRDRLLHERADEIVALKDQHHRLRQELSIVQQRSAAAAASCADQIHGLERELFESKKQQALTEATRSVDAADLGRQLRSAQDDLQAARSKLERSGTLNAMLYARDGQIKELTYRQTLLEKELTQMRAQAESSSRQEREQSAQTIDDLKKAVSFHADTIDKLQSDKQSLNGEIQQLQNLVSVLQRCSTPFEFTFFVVVSVVYFALYWCKPTKLFVYMFVFV